MFNRLALAGFCILWIAFTFYRPMNLLNHLGELLSYNTGVNQLQPLDEQSKTLVINAPDQYDLEIHLDEWGVPHIYGQNEASVAFGVGYMHARDRYFQMEMMTRKAQGKLAEFVGIRGLESDRFWLPMELDIRAQKLLKKLKTDHPKVYRDVMAYGDGVMTYLKNEKANQVPPEYNLTGEKPRIWKHHYSLLLSTYMAYMLSYSDQALQRQTVLDLLPADLRQELFEHDADLAHSIIPDTVFGQRPPTDLAPEKPLESSAYHTGKVLPFEEKTLGSNNWAISARKSSSGNAVLCNDTHLDLVLPSPWYEAHLFCPQYNCYGLTLPCGPYVVSGHNEQIAWGMTNAYWDENDQFELNVDPKDSTRFELNGSWKKMHRKKYEITIKGVGIKEWTVDRTELGVVHRIKEKTFAKRWYPAEQDNISFVTFEKMTHASDWKGFLEAMRYYSFPPQNFAFADIEGNAGILCAGSLPLRPNFYRGGIRDGKVSAPIRYLPFDQLPKVLNPKRGFVSSANQLPAKANYYISYTYAEPYRAKRINEVLEQKEKLNIEDLMKLHGDVTDVSVRDVQALLKKYPAKGDEKKIFDQLARWNGTLQNDSQEAFEAAYLNYFLLNSFDSILRSHYPVEMQSRYRGVYTFLLKHETFKLKNKSYQTAKLMQNAYRKARLQLIEDFGPKIQVNQAQARTFDIKHLLSLPGWGNLVPDAGGNHFTPNVHKGIHGASMRTVIEMNPKGVKSYMVIAGGQSGRVNSPHYRDQLQHWQQVNYHEVQMCREASELKHVSQQIRFK